MKVILHLWLTVSIFSSLTGLTCAAAIQEHDSDYRLFDNALAPSPSRPAREKEEASLKRALNAFQLEGSGNGVAAVEQFLHEFPESRWSPALRAYMGTYYREHGSYSLALNHWETAWHQSHTETNAAIKPVADYVLVKWTRLLASLGRAQQLQKLFAETADRPLDGGPLQQTFLKTKEGYGMMLSRPGIAYRCGTYALTAVGNLLTTNHIGRRFADIPSPTTGFSLSNLSEFASNADLPLTCVRRTNSTVILVPSVIHWKQNHFAAITRQHGDLFYVTDPTFEYPLWLTADQINSEASGYFMVCLTNAHGAFSGVTKDEGSHVFGKGFPFGFLDHWHLNCTADPSDPNSCPACRPPSPNHSSNQGSQARRSNIVAGPGDRGPTDPAPPTATCSDCDGTWARGMAVWSVTEPFINLLVEDEPLAYQAHQGPQVIHRLFYRQRDEVDRNTNVFSFGKLWNAWLYSYLDDNNPADNSLTNVTLYNPGGGYVTYSDGSLEGVSNTRLERMTTNANSGFRVRYSSGGYDEYNVVIVGAGANRAYLSARKDSVGNTVQFVYSTNNSIVRLLYVVDAQGLTNSFTYATNHPYSSNLIAGVTDPYGRSASLAYDSSGHLTNITDALGLASSFAYDSQGWMTNLTTPYGTTSFALASYWAGGESPLSREATVTHPDGAKELYLYRDDWTGLVDIMTNDFPSSTTMPTDAYNSLLEQSPSWRSYRNSAYWNRYQYQYLSSATQTNVANVTSNEVRFARLRHWLNGPNADDENLTSALSFERGPAADASGTELPAPIWYGWHKLLDADFTPTILDMSHPAVVAIRLADGATRFTWKEYNFAGNLTNVTIAYGPADDVGWKHRSFTYYSTGNDLFEAFDFSGNLVVSNVLDGGYVIESYDALLQKTTYEWSGSQILDEVDPAGLTTTNTFSGGFLVSSVNYEIGATNSFTYTNGMLFTRTDPRGLTVTNHYDALDRLVSTHFPDGTYTSNRYTLLDLTASRDRLGNWTYFAYDSERRLVATTNVNNAATTYSYCECGSVNAVTNALGEVTQYFHDLAGRLISTHFADGAWRTNIYDRAGQLSAVLQSSGVSLTNYFNTEGLLYAKSNAFGGIITKGFDFENRVTSSTDANGVSITTGYDHLGRITSRTYADGAESFGYSAAGLVTHNDPLSHTTHYGYDAARRRVAETNAGGEWTLFSYDAAGDLLTLKDGKDQTTTWKYDVYGRVTNKLDATSSEIFRYGYDANGRLTNRWSPEKLTTGYSYDAAGNLTNVDYPHSTDLRMRYDALNRLISMTDAAGMTAFSYGADGFVASEDGPWNDDVVTYAYTNRLISSVSVAPPQSYSAAWQQSYGYDTASRLKTVTSPSGTFTYNHLRAGNLFTNLALPNSAIISNSFDSVGRMVTTALRNSGGTVLDSYSYIYNPVGQRTNITRATGDWVEYGYDPVGQLTSATGYRNGGSGDFDFYSYGYDAAHNLTNRGVYVWLPQSFNVNSLNQLTSVVTPPDIFRIFGYTTGAATNVTINAAGTDYSADLYSENRFATDEFDASGVSGIQTISATAHDTYGRAATASVTCVLPGTNTFQYDLNGNLTNAAGRSLEYDDENQLTRITQTNAWQSEFTYDGRMRRKVRREYLWQNGAFQPVEEVRYVYDGKLVVQERHYDLRLPVSEAVTLVNYTRGLALGGSITSAGGIGGLLERSEQTARDPHSSPAYYHCDGNGNVTMLIDKNQKVAAHYVYDPFGSVLASGGSLAEGNLYRFSTKEFHVTSGLVYYLYRYYDSQLQRWINRDPIGESGGLHLYAFLNNRGLNTLDSWGLDAHDDFCASLCLEQAFWEAMLGTPIMGAAAPAMLAGTAAALESEGCPPCNPPPPPPQEDPVPKPPLLPVCRFQPLQTQRPWPGLFSPGWNTGINCGIVGGICIGGPILVGGTVVAAPGGGTIVIRGGATVLKPILQGQ